MKNLVHLNLQIPPIGYLEKLRKICTDNDIILIFDDVITGFGRLGKPFAADFFNIEPDLMAIAKGLTSGTVPMAATFVSDKIYRILSSIFFIFCSFSLLFLISSFLFVSSCTSIF